jgi:type III restriction enzyme
MLGDAMSNPFFDRPILNSPYEYPVKHWELDETGQPTQRVIESRRGAKFITPIPKPKKRKAATQKGFVFDEGKGLSTAEQQYDPTSIINEVRGHVDTWRTLPNPSQWQVTPETARLLRHWRHHDFSGVRPFFCQIEAVETAIWLTEVAPHTRQGKRLIDHLAAANKDANPELMRLALKLATGAGKTTVMAMLIAWQAINASRHEGSKNFTRGFLICAPGLTIKDRLRVLQPNDPENYYSNREIVPHDMLDDVNRAKIVITNYHAFKLRERIDLSKGGRQLLKGRTGDDLNTLETEGQMIQRVMSELMGLKNIIVINDEAHHCYREKPKEPDDEDLKGDDRKEAEKNNEAARLWISGIEAVNRKLGVSRVIDLSATPFFLRGSGYAEGTLFPWTMSDFSLMDAIECGIVKLPRVPVAENIPGNEMPMYRDLWENIRKDMPKKGRGQGEELDPLKLPTRLQTAIEALYGHYEKTFKLWEETGIKVPPCFIIVCQNTAISKLVYDFVSGFHRKNADGTTTLQNSRFALFRNFDETTGNPLPRPNTLLIDSEQLEAGDALDDNFRAMAADEIDRFRRDIVERTGDARAGDNISEQDLLREVMNTVGKYGQLGGSIRCVVSVSMLTEGWDANTVTHVLGIRAFGTQLLCEQVIGRALRRQSYDLNDEGLFNVEVCKGGTYPAQLMYQELADMACNRITAAITRKFLGERPIKALLDPYNHTGSTRHVRFNTSRADRWETNGPPPKSQVNWVILDSDWEAEFCRVAEAHPKVMAYTKNHNLGLEVPYRYGSENRKYLPDFIVRVDDGQGPDDLLNLIVEIKGYRREDAKEKKATMDTYWVPGVNHLGTYGRWAFAELGDVYEIGTDFEAKVRSEFEKMLERAAQADFERRLTKEQAEGFRARMEEEPPIGMLPDGTLNVVEPGAPPFKPTIIRDSQ